LKFWTGPVILEFLYGILVAFAYRRGVRVEPVFAIVLVVAALALLARFANLEPRWISWGIPAAMIGAAVILLPQARDGRIVRWLALAGGASYALYLSHPFSVNLVGLFWRHFFADRWPAGFVVTAIGVAVIVSLIFYVLIEQPMASAAKRLFSRSD
jgi:peptidoglycan/LPS O-acetylase OafA/YrhL